jgi:hypothetical protein
MAIATRSEGLWVFWGGPLPREDIQRFRQELIHRDHDADRGGERGCATVRRD